MNSDTTQQRPWISDIGYEQMVKLAHGLVTKVPDENFWMGNWFASEAKEDHIMSWESPGYHTLAKLAAKLAELDCGTVGCAIGHATWILGDAIKMADNGFFEVGDQRSLDGFTAASQLFGIARHASERLFGLHKPDDRIHVANRLLHFAETGGL